MEVGDWVRLQSKNDNLVHFWREDKKFRVKEVYELGDKESVYVLNHENGDTLKCMVMGSEVKEIKEGRRG